MISLNDISLCYAVPYNILKINEINENNENNEIITITHKQI